MDDLQTRVYYQSLGLVRHDANLRLEGNFQALFKIFNDALSSLQERHLCYRLSLFLNNPKGIRELHRALKDAVKYFSRYHELLGTLSISGEHRTKRRGTHNLVRLVLMLLMPSDRERESYINHRIRQSGKRHLLSTSRGPWSCCCLVRGSCGKSQGIHSTDASGFQWGEGEGSEVSEYGIREPRMYMILASLSSCRARRGRLRVTTFASVTKLM